jgi:hypothetical protein
MHRPTGVGDKPMETNDSRTHRTSGTDAKSENNDWEATSIKWGREFVVYTEIEGNEAAGEQIYHDLDAAVFVCLQETDLFAPEPRPDEHGDIARDETKTATFESDLNTVTVTLAGDASIVGEGWEAIETVVAEELPDGFDRVATDGGHKEIVTGHIDLTDGGAVDVFLNGERMFYRDGYGDAVELQTAIGDSVTAITIGVDPEDGIGPVSGEHWTDPDAAFWEDGEVLDFEPTDSEEALLTWAEVDGDRTVELRRVGGDEDGDSA